MGTPKSNRSKRPVPMCERVQQDLARLWSLSRFSADHTPSARAGSQRARRWSRYRNGRPRADVDLAFAEAAFALATTRVTPLHHCRSTTAPTVLRLEQWEPFGFRDRPVHLGRPSTYQPDCDRDRLEIQDELRVSLESAPPSPGAAVAYAVGRQDSSGQSRRPRPR